MAQVRGAPHLALAIGTLLARVQDTQPLEQAINPLVRVRCAPHLAPALRTRLARVQDTQPLALVLETRLVRLRNTQPQALVLQIRLVRVIHDWRWRVEHCWRG